jgi:hypothetical protein
MRLVIREFRQGAGVADMTANWCSQPLQATVSPT